MSSLVTIRSPPAPVRVGGVISRSRRRATAFALASVVALVVGAACSGDDDSATGAASSSTAAPTTTTTSAPVPGADWDVVAPETVGLDPAALQQVATTAETGKSNCLVVVRDGKIAGEWYFRGTNAETTQNVFSMTKSVASTLVGIAQDDGDLDINDPASTWITEWKGTPSDAVKVRDILSNDSGREWSLAIDYVQLLQAQDRTTFAIGLTQAAAPGTVWAYNNSAIQTLQRVVQQATGTPVRRLRANSASSRRSG